jgi:hypothetical protein
MAWSSSSALTVDSVRSVLVQLALEPGQGGAHARRLKPTNPDGLPSRRDHTHVAKHSGLHLAIRRTSETAAYTSVGSAFTMTLSATSSGM